MPTRAAHAGQSLRPRYYLGLAGTAHDGAVAVVDRHGQIVYAEATERWLQHKRAWGVYPDERLRLRHVIATHCDPDAEVVVAKAGTDRGLAFLEREAKLVGTLTREAEKRAASTASRGIARATRLQQARLSSYQHLLEVAVLGQKGVGLNSRFELAGRVVATRAYDHHLCHAAFASYTSPFERAACAVVDGFGEGTSLKFFALRGTQLTQVGGADPAPLGATASLGLFYADLCRLCGFDPWKGEEWKVMGLAPYGRLRDDQLHDLRRCLRIAGLELEHCAESLSAWTRLAEHERKPGSPPESVADLARAGQEVFEELMAELLRELHARTGECNLVLGGGCALNSSCNGKLLRTTPFEALHVPFAPADDGNAVGAALLAFAEDHPGHERRPAISSPFLGSRVCRRTLRRAAESGAFHRVEVLPREAMAGRLAAALEHGLLVGVIEGRAEFGPRALGHRSILADPRRPEMKDRINAAVKFREHFRPFAPAVLDERGHEFFVDYESSPYMERTLLMRTHVRDRVPAVVHADGTGRLQSIQPEWSELLHALVREFDRSTGIPMVVNTSFNVMGKPIAHSVEDALAVFATSGLDVLAIEDHLFVKPTATPGRP